MDSRIGDTEASGVAASASARGRYFFSAQLNIHFTLNLSVSVPQ